MLSKIIEQYASREDQSISDSSDSDSEYWTSSTGYGEKNNVDTLNSPMKDNQGTFSSIQFGILIDIIASIIMDDLFLLQRNASFLWRRVILKIKKCLFVTLKGKWNSP